MPESDRFQTKLKYWEQLRNVVVHEDNLVNNRLTWLMTVEGFLIAGFAAFCASILTNADKLACLRSTVGDSFLSTFAIAAVGIFFVGSVLCLVTSVLVLAAIERVADVEGAWCRRYPEEREDFPDFPHLFGRLPEGARRYLSEERHAKMVLLSIPAVLILINSGIAAFIICEAKVVLGWVAWLSAVVYLVLLFIGAALTGVMRIPGKRKR